MSILNTNQRVGTSSRYEWKSGTVNVAGTNGTTNLNTVNGFTTLFDSVRQARYVKIEVSANTYIRLNSATNDKVLVTATTPLELDMSVSNIFVSTNGSDSTVTVTLTA